MLAELFGTIGTFVIINVGVGNYRRIFGEVGRIGI